MFTGVATVGKISAASYSKGMCGKRVQNMRLPERAPHIRSCGFYMETHIIRVPRRDPKKMCLHMYYMTEDEAPALGASSSGPPSTGPREDEAALEIPAYEPPRQTLMPGLQQPLSSNMLISVAKNITQCATFFPITISPHRTFICLHPPGTCDLLYVLIHHDS